MSAFSPPKLKIFLELCAWQNHFGKKPIGTMHLASHIQATSWFFLFSPSPLEGEGWDEGEIPVVKHPSPFPLPQGERVY
jgi:hypothetical protein